MNTSTSIKSPIFIHSLFRSGSTYFFTKFRQVEGTWCYQEPFHEELLKINSEPEEIIKHFRESAKKWNHPELGKPYFYEFYAIKRELNNLIDESTCYDGYFTQPDDFSQQGKYIQALIDKAKGTPVLQFCRSTGRLNALTHLFNPFNIFIYRETYNLWLSYKVQPYFDAALQMIYNAKNIPDVLRKIKSICNIDHVAHKDIYSGFNFYMEHTLSTRKSYMLLYALWLYSCIEAKKYAHLLISIDKLSVDCTYKQKIAAEFNRIGIDSIDFYDCRIPYSSPCNHAITFIQDIEQIVSATFIDYGYTPEILSYFATKNQDIREYMSTFSATSSSNKNLHLLTFRLLDQLSDIHQYLQHTNLLEEKLIQSQQWGKDIEDKLKNTIIQIRDVEDKYMRLKSDNIALNEEIKRLHIYYSESQEKLDKQHSYFINSMSWKITAPLRFISLHIRKIIRLLKKTIPTRKADKGSVSPEEHQQNNQTNDNHQVSDENMTVEQHEVDQQKQGIELELSDHAKSIYFKLRRMVNQ